MTFIFPRIKFVESNGIATQILHIGKEYQEAYDASFTPDIQHTAEEVMDCLHACETALRILNEKYGINLHKLRRDVERKNFDRGYYDVE